MEDRDSIHKINAFAPKEIFTRKPKACEIYYLMKQNTKVCSFNRSTGQATLFQEESMPLDLYLEFDTDADLYNNRQVFDLWCAKRILSLDRENAKVILNSCGLRQVTTDYDRATIALRCKCLMVLHLYLILIMPLRHCQNLHVCQNFFSEGK